MKKIIYLLLILIVVMFNICACNKNDEKSNNNLENQNSQVTNQGEITQNTHNSNVLNSGESIKETFNEEQKESGNKMTEVIEKIGKEVNEESKEKIDNIVGNEKDNKLEEKEQTSKSQSISVSATSLSNKTNAWGFVRKKNEVRPEFAAQYTKVLDDYEGIYAGNPDEKVIYLTFDEGYENGYTGAILDTLKAKDCPATFFVTKPYVKQNQDLVKRMIDEGHIVRQPYC